MRSQYKQSIIIRIISNQKLVSILGLLLLVLISMPLAKNASRRHKVNSEIRELQKEIRTIESKNTDLQQLIRYLESDQFAEEQARLNLGLKKDGESVAIVKTGEPSDAGEPDEPKSETVFNIPGLAKSQNVKVGNPAKWKAFFLNSESKYGK